jgi:hypothetical protein
MQAYKFMLTLKQFKPLIANVFYKAGFVESWGKGMNNIIETCLKMGLPIRVLRVLNWRKS